MDHYYEIGARLRRLDPLEPYGPDNCEFYFPTDSEMEMSLEQRKTINNWNRTVNVLRKHYGMTPFKEIPEEDMYERTRKSASAESAPADATEES